MGAGLLAVAAQEDTARVRTPVRRRAADLEPGARARGERCAATGARPVGHPARVVACGVRSLLGILACAASPVGPARAQERAEVVVSPAGPVRTIAAALALVRTGGRIVVEAGTYREPTIVVDARRGDRGAGPSRARRRGDARHPHDRRGRRDGARAAPRARGLELRRGPRRAAGARRARLRDRATTGSRTPSSGSTSPNVTGLPHRAQRAAGAPAGARRRRATASISGRRAAS